MTSCSQSERRRAAYEQKSSLVLVGADICHNTRSGGGELGGGMNLYALCLEASALATQDQQLI